MGLGEDATYNAIFAGNNVVSILESSYLSLAIASPEEHDAVRPPAGSSTVYNLDSPGCLIHALDRIVNDIVTSHYLDYRFGLRGILY